MKAKITFEVQAPEDCSITQFENWVKMELGMIPMDVKSPMFFYDLRCRAENLKIQIKE